MLDGKSEISIELKYHNGEPVIRELRRVSKPGRRIYAGVRELPDLWPTGGVDATPAPYFDNVRLETYRATGPALAAEVRWLAEPDPEARTAAVLEGRADIVINLGGPAGPMKMRNGHIVRVSDTELEGYYDRTDGTWGGPPAVRIFFVVRFEKPFSEFTTYEDRTHNSTSGLVTYDQSKNDFTVIFGYVGTARPLDLFDDFPPDRRRTGPRQGPVLVRSTCPIIW